VRRHDVGRTCAMNVYTIIFVRRTPVRYVWWCKHCLSLRSNWHCVPYNFYTNIFKIIYIGLTLQMWLKLFCS